MPSSYNLLRNVVWLRTGIVNSTTSLLRRTLVACPSRLSTRDRKAGSVSTTASTGSPSGNVSGSTLSSGAPIAGPALFGRSRVSDDIRSSLNCLVCHSAGSSCGSTSRPTRYQRPSRSQMASEATTRSRSRYRNRNRHRCSWPWLANARE